jgi:hypothetical protein
LIGDGSIPAIADLAGPAVVIGAKNADDDDNALAEAAAEN